MNERISELIRHQNESRENWKGNDTSLGISKMILAESQELVDSINNDVDGSVFPIASEIGDVGYLLYRLCIDLGIDLDDAIEMKIRRNELKYPSELNSTGTYEDGVLKSKEQWKLMGGDKTFSEVYLNTTEAK